jgi:pimeloyl-ACP methyl ester carboxylesterase
MLSSLDEWIAGGSHVTLAGHKIFFRQDGPSDGKPISLLHGYPTSCHDWSPIVPALVAAGGRVTTLDFVGFGASDKPAGHVYSIEEQATIVEQLWARLGIDDTALVAHDYGVSVAQELLARKPRRVTRMAWLNGGIYFDLHRPLFIQRLMHGPLGDVFSHFMSETTYRMSLRKILKRPVADEDLHQMWLATQKNGGLRVLRPLLRYMDDRRRQGARWQRALETFRGPMLFIWGPADPVSGAHVLPRVRERLPHAKVVVLDEPPATGHYPQVENPAAVAAALTDFLSAP